MTTAPAPANLGASSFDAVAPLENRAMSTPARSALAASSTTSSVSPNGSTRPSDLEDANSLTSSAGKARSTSTARMTEPT